VSAFVALAFATFLPMALINLTGATRVASLLVTLCGLLSAGSVRWLVHAGRLPDEHLDVASGCLLALLGASSLVAVALSGRPGNLPVLLMSVIGIGAVVVRRRLVLLLIATCCAGWVGTVLGRGVWHGTELVDHALALLMACVMSVGVHTVRTRSERTLRLTRDRLDAQVGELLETRSALGKSARRFHGVFAGSPVGIGLADEQGLFVEVNAALATLLGRSPAELIGRSSRGFTHPDDLAQHAATQQNLEAAEDGVLRVEKRFIRPDGEVVWAWLTISSVPGPDGERYTLAHMLDVTDRKRAEQQLQNSRDDLTAIAAVARCGQTGADPRPVVVDVVRRLAGASTVALVEAEGDDLVATACHGTVDITGMRVSRTETAATVHAFLTGERVFVPDVSVDPLANPRLTEGAQARSMLMEPVRGDAGVVAVLAVIWQQPVTSLQDRSVLVVETLAGEIGAALTAERLRSQLESLATTDPLTGLVNRRGWYERLQLLTAQGRRTGDPLTLAIADLDRFKDFNDSRGHEAGDQLLRAFADAASSVLREVDVVARWGGEEFAIALPGCDATSAMAVLDRLRLNVPEAQTCSFGLAEWDVDETVTACLRRADEALYRAKGAGRDRIAC
jgi:diguanylate cyclase (GGDEF)-like protein/PAS domain S-box-containing protein